MKFLLPFLLICLLIFACKQNDNNTNVLPSCDSIHISYKQDIQPIFAQNCYSCHATAVTQNGGLDLEDTISLKSYLQYGFRGDGIYGSKLYHCILHSLLALPMPPTTIIDSCSQHKIHYWLSIGAPCH